MIALIFILIACGNRFPSPPGQIRESTRPEGHCGKRKDGKRAASSSGGKDQTEERWQGQLFVGTDRLGCGSGFKGQRKTEEAIGRRAPPLGTA